MKDWIGDAGFINGLRRKDCSDPHDYYATEPKATKHLLEAEKFCNHIWEPACGEGHISKVLLEHGYCVFSTDLVDRGFGTGGVDFFGAAPLNEYEFDIITNPPYRCAQEFCAKALEIVPVGSKVALLLKLTFLEGKKRRNFFDKHPPEKVLVFSSRVCCGKNGDFKPGQNAVTYAWFIWRKGYQGAPVIKWIG